MINKKSVLAVIPARSGSKGIKDKNIRLLHGKPLLAWSIEAALCCPYVDRVFLSTDSAEYAQIGISFGAEVPCLRPKELSSDTAKSSDVIIHGLDVMSSLDNDFQIVVLLEPTSPLRTVGDISESIELVDSSRFSAAVGVCLAESIHPSFMFTRSLDSGITPFLGKQPEGLRRQDIKPLYYLEGSVYTSDVSVFRKEKTFYHADTAGVLIPYERSAEIDTEVDFLLVDALLKLGRVV